MIIAILLVRSINSVCFFGVHHSPVDFRAHSRVYPRSLPRLSALTPASIRAHSRVYPRSLPRLSTLTPAHSHLLPHVLMHEYRRQNGKSHFFYSIS